MKTNIIIGGLLILPIVIRMCMSMIPRHKYGSANNALIFLILALLGISIIFAPV